MKRLAAGLSVLALAGCPAWDDERIARCLALDASTGVCEGVGGGGVGGAGGAGGAGGTGGGSGGGSGTDAGINLGDGGVSAYPSAAATRTLQTYGETARRPVFLWQEPQGGPLVAIESREDKSITVWINPQAFTRGVLPSRTWCASAGNEASNLLGTAAALSATSFGINVDYFDGGDVVGNADYALTACPSALSHFRQGDGGFAFLAISSKNGNQVFVERTAAGGVKAQTSYPLVGNRIDEAASDLAQTTWVSGHGGSPLRLVVLELKADGSPMIVHPLGDAGAARVELAAFGSSVHAAWIDGQRLWLHSLTTDAGQRQSWDLPAPARLADLVQNANGIVAVLDFSGNRPAILIHTPAASSFHLIGGGLPFVPATAYLRGHLFIAAQCGASDSNCPALNPILEFDTQPGGSPW